MFRGSLGMSGFGSRPSSERLSLMTPDFKNSENLFAASTACPSPVYPASGRSFAVFMIMTSALRAKWASNFPLAWRLSWVLKVSDIFFYLLNQTLSKGDESLDGIDDPWNACSRSYCRFQSRTARCASLGSKHCIRQPILERLGG